MDALVSESCEAHLGQKLGIERVNNWLQIKIEVLRLPPPVPLTLLIIRGVQELLRSHFRTNGAHTAEVKRYAIRFNFQE